MTIKKMAAVIGKVLLSGVLALAILTGFCFFYYNVPLNFKIDNGATDYKWEADTFHSRATEGITWGRTDKDGYSNMFTYSPEEGTDVLIMGSSHMEAFQVAQDESTASRLNELLPDDVVYNIGISGHTFPVCVSNLETAVKKYQPSKYVVIETDSITFSDKDLEETADGTLPELTSDSGGVLGRLKRNQFLRLMYMQLQNYMSSRSSDKDDDADQGGAVRQKSDVNTALLDKVLGKVEGIAQAESVRVIILFHPTMQIEPDTSMTIRTDEEALKLFDSLCRKHGITLLDMSERFLQEYDKSNVLPYGFVNSPVGSGHLNRYGHDMIAQELYKIISEAE